MIDPAYVRLMAVYNRWQNRSLYTAAAELDDEARKRDRGAFFGSIHGTLNHLVWGDQIWMSRLAGRPAPVAQTIGDSVAQFAVWGELRATREALDDVIADWGKTLTAADLAGDLTWFSQSAGRQITHPRSLLVIHVFNHQTHHRGQVHAMLTAAGARPEATDLPFMTS